MQLICENLKTTFYNFEYHNMKIPNKNIFKNITTLRFDLLIIFIISILSILSIDFWLINVPEIFNGGAILGQLVYGLSFSYVSAFIFYFFVVHLKDQKDKDNLYPYIADKVLFIVEQGKGLINACAKSAQVSIVGNYPNDSELLNICKAIDPNSKSPLAMGVSGHYANWRQYFEYFMRRSNDATSRILSKMQFLDSDLVIKLVKIEDCNLFNTLTFFSSMPLGNTDFTNFKPDIAEYLKLIDDLEKYYIKNLKKTAANK